MSETSNENAGDMDPMTADENALVEHLLTASTEERWTMSSRSEGDQMRPVLAGPYIIRGDEQDCIGQLCDRFGWQWAPGDQGPGDPSVIWGPLRPVDVGA